MAGARKKIGSQKKPSKSKAAQAAANRRRQQRKATGQAAQKAGKYKSIKASDAAKRARSRASERRKKSRQQAAAQAAAAAKIRAAEKARANTPPPGTRTVRANTPPPGTRTVRANTPPPGTRTIRANTPPPGTRTGSRPFPRVRPQPKPPGMSLSRFKAGLYNLLPEGMRQAGSDTSGMTAKEKFDANPARQAFIRSRERRKKRRDRAADNVVPPRPTEEVDPYRGTPDMPPEIIEDYFDRFPTGPGYGGGMMGGLGAFGYNPALMAFESQQGAGQVPYYMAAARNAMTPNMSPAFMHASRNYDILGGMQRTAPRPMEMMSAAERAQIAGMSNFSTPNYNSPYDQFNFFSNMVGGGGGKGMGRPMPQMGSGLGAFYGGFA